MGKIIVGLDIGLTTGFGVLKMEGQGYELLDSQSLDWTHTTTGAISFDIRFLLSKLLVDVVVMELPLLRNTEPAFQQLYTITTTVREVVMSPRVTWETREIYAATWKNTPAKLKKIWLGYVPKHLGQGWAPSTHEKDALQIAYWYGKYGKPRI